MRMRIEYTDTFGGDANYSWVRRAELDFPDNASDRSIIRKLKAEVGMTGRHRKSSFDEEITLTRWALAGLRSFFREGFSDALHHHFVRIESRDSPG